MPVKIRGVVESTLNKNVIYKTVKKGQSSFRITKALLDDAFNKSTKLGNTGELILTIPINDKETYIVSCQIKKEVI